MNIWIIQTGEPLPIAKGTKQMRTAILADKLIERGHSILWWASAFDHFKKNWIFKKDSIVNINENYKIFAIKGKGYRKNISLSRLIDHRFVAWKFRKLAPKMQMPDIIVASMPPHDLAYEAVMFAHNNKIPVLVDIRDTWPDIFLDHIKGIFKKVLKIILHGDFAMAQKTMQTADGLIAVTNTFLKWGLRYKKKKKNEHDRVFHLGYKKPLVRSFSKIKKRFLPVIDKIENKFVIFFVGTISGLYHNPFILLEVAKRISNNKNIHFIIGGDGELFNELKESAKNLYNVTLTGWLNQDEIEFWLKYSHIGVCPVTQEIDLPTNKIFTYLSAGLPVISAFQGDSKEIIENYQIGFYYPPNDVRILTDCILKLYEDSNLYKKMSENARKLFKEMFDADKIYEEYAEHVERIAKEGNKTDG